MPDLWPYFGFFGLLTAFGIWLFMYGVRGLANKYPSTPLSAGDGPIDDPLEEVTALPRVAQRRWARPVSQLGRRLLGQRDAARLEDRPSS